MAVDVRRIRIEAPQVLMHDRNLRLEHLVLLLRFANVFAVTLKPLDFAVELSLLMLGGADIVDGWFFVSSCLRE